MKEIDYITKNIDVKKFLGLIKKEGDTLLIEEIFDSVKNPNNKIRGLLKEYVFYGLFFNRVKKLSLTYDVCIAIGGEVYPELRIICFYSDTDKKYRLLSFENTGGNFLEQEYRLVKIFNKKPTEQQIEVEFEDRMKEFSQFQTCQFLFNDGIGIISLHPDTEEIYLDQLMLERGKSISKIHSKAKEKALRLVQKDGFELQNLPAHFKKDKEVVLEAIEEIGYALEYADDSLKKDKEIILKAIKTNGDVLQYADKSLKKDRKFILEAVKQNGVALEFVEESLKKDQEVVLEAVKRSGWALQFADKNLKKNKEIVLEAVKHTGFALEFADKSLKKDKEIVLETVKSHAVHFPDNPYPDDADDSLRNDPDILAIVNKKKK